MISLAIIGFLLIALSILALVWSGGVSSPFSGAGIMIGLILLLIGAVTSGLSIIFDWILQWWFIILPIAIIIAFKLLYKKKEN